MKNKTIIYLFFSFLLIRCAGVDEKELKISQDPKWVVHSFISPQDTLITAYFSVSQPLYKNLGSIPSFQGAQISISNGTETLLLVEQEMPANLYINYFNVFSSKPTFKIEEGKTYYLNVIAPDGKKLTSQCTIPISIVPTSQPTIEFIPVTNSFGDFDQYGINMQWNLPSNSAYYHFTNPYFYVDSATFFSSFTFVGTSNLQYRFIDDIESYFTEAKAPVINVKASPNGLPRNRTFAKEEEEKFINSLHFKLLVTDEIYYRYNSVVRKNWELINYSKEDVAFMEPISPYSNIQGGLGAFCGYTVVYEQ